MQREVISLILMEMMKGVRSSNLLLFQYLQKVKEHIRLQQTIASMLMSSSFHIKHIQQKRSRSLQRSKIIKQKYKKRKFWVDPDRSSDWWTNLFKGSLPESTWEETLRITKDSFMIICDELRPFIHRETSSFRKPITVEARVAMALHYLVSEGGGLRLTAEKFGIAKSTLCIIIREVCHYIKTELGPKHIVLPKNETSVRLLCDNFQAKHGLPQCIGSLSNTKIKILKSQQQSAHRINRKPVYSLSVQAACDYQLKFFDVVVVKSQGDENGSPGAVFNNCSLNACLRDGVIPSCPVEVLSSEPEVPIYVMGDKCYPSRTYLMKRYPPAESIREERKQFEECASSALGDINDAFEMVKGRFRILKTAMTMRLEFLPTVIYACFTLHNFLQNRGENGESLIDRSSQQSSNSFDELNEEQTDFSQAHIYRDICCKYVAEKSVVT